MEELNLSMIYLIYCKNFCKCHNVPPPSTTIKKSKNKKEKGEGKSTGRTLSRPAEEQD
jgi:hypothetical protein